MSSIPRVSVKGHTAAEKPPPIIAESAIEDDVLSGEGDLTCPPSIGTLKSTKHIPDMRDLQAFTHAGIKEKRAQSGYLGRRVQITS